MLYLHLQVFRVQNNDGATEEISGDKQTDSVTCVEVCESLDTYEERSKKVAEVLDDLRKRDLFVSLKGWRDEVMCHFKSSIFCKTFLLNKFEYY